MRVCSALRFSTARMPSEVSYTECDLRTNQGEWSVWYQQPDIEKDDSECALQLRINRRLFNQSTALF